MREASVSPAPSHLHAILWVLASTAIWTLIFAAAKFADAFAISSGGSAMGVFQITLLRYLGALAGLAVLVALRGGLRAHRSRQLLTHLLRAFCGTGAAVAITWASARMPIADATAFAMLYGVALVLLGVVFLGERLGRAHGLAVGVSVAGAAAVLLAQGAFRGALPVGPALVALASAGLMAVEGLLIRVLGRAEPAPTVMLHVGVFGLLLMLVPAWLTWQPVGWGAMLACLALGPAGLLGQYATIRGYREALLSVVGPVDYSWLVFAMLLGWLVFAEPPALATLAGSALILAGGVMLVRAGASSAAAPAPDRGP